MNLSITDNISSVSRGLTKIGRKQIPFVTAQTLSQLAFEAMQEEKLQVPRHLDRPTPYTKSGFKYRRANKRDLEALVYIDKSEPGGSRDYMRFPIHGGVSKAKGRALTHPTKNTKLNRYGNLPRNFAAKALAKKSKFFSGIPRGMNGQENAGVWERHGGKRNPRIKMVVQWKTSRLYTAKFPFYAIAGRVVAKRTNRIFNEQFERAMRTAK